LAIHLNTIGTPIPEAWAQSPCYVLYEMARRAPGQNIDMQLGNQTFHIVQEAAAARHILRANLENYPKYFAQYKGFFGQSRLTSDGAAWRKLRDRSQPFITEVPPQHLVDVARGYFSAAITTLTTGRSVNIDTEVDFAAASTICDTVLGFPFADWGRAALADMHLVLGFSTFATMPRSLTNSDFFQSRQNAANLALARLDATFKAVVAQKGGARHGLLGSIQRDENIGVDLFGEIATHLFAGFDTTAACISWSLYLLALNPDLQERLRQDVAKLSDTELASVAGLETLSDLRGFIQESLRIFPPIPLVSRRILAEDRVNDWRLHPKNLVILSMIGLHHDTTIFSNPTHVDLTRNPRDFAGHFIPFGDGQRVCPGARFANLEVLCALAMFLRRVRVLPSGAPSLQFRWDASMRRDQGNHLILQPL
jgi:cytochrome P450